MNADRLFALYDRVAEAPDAVGRLRRFVLDLAVRGKLVKQDPADEPASELLKRISAEKARLVKAGEIRNPKKIPVIDTNELPFDPPRGWEWTRLLEISRKIHYGYTASANRMIESVRLLRITDIQDNRVDWFSVPGCEIEEKVLPKFKLERGDVLIARTGGTIGKSFLVQDVPVTAVFASYLIRIQGSHEIHDRYLKLFLESPAYWTQLRDGARGAGQPNVNGQILGKITVPLPPLVEQHRIVAKVNELMALCDRLEEARTAREDTRDGLTKASLTRLVAPDIDAPTFRSHARFAVDALPALTARADQVKQLRQTILNLAVRGKLVKQDPADEPASELLKRISAEKARLVKAGEIRNPKKIPVIDTNELPFDPPRGWEWTRLLEISRKIHYGYTASANRMIESVRLLRITDIQDNRVDWFSVPGCEIEEKVLPKFKLERGDVLIARTGGTIGKSFLVQDVPVTAVFASYLIRIQGSHEIHDRYLKLFLESPAYWTQLRDGARGAGQPNVNGQILGKITVPLPPLVEQHRIVAKVNELMALCDRMETGLATADVTRTRLLDSLLVDALASAAYEASTTTRLEARNTSPERARGGGVPSRS